MFKCRLCGDTIRFIDWKSTPVHFILRHLAVLRERLPEFQAAPEEVRQLRACPVCGEIIDASRPAPRVVKLIHHMKHQHPELLNRIMDVAREYFEKVPSKPLAPVSASPPTAQSVTPSQITEGEKNTVQGVDMTTVEEGTGKVVGEPVQTSVVQPSPSQPVSAATQPEQPPETKSPAMPMSTVSPEPIPEPPPPVPEVPATEKPEEEEEAKEEIVERPNLTEPEQGSLVDVIVDYSTPYHVKRAHRPMRPKRPKEGLKEKEEKKPEKKEEKPGRRWNYVALALGIGALVAIAYMVRKKMSKPTLPAAQMAASHPLSSVPVPPQPPSPPAEPPQPVPVEPASTNSKIRIVR